MQVNSQKYAVVDLEATGAHAMAEIIQVGIVIIENNKIVGAICAAPFILGRKGLLKGKSATCFPGFENELDGAKVVEYGVMGDGMIVTARGAGVAWEFGAAICSRITGEQKALDILEAIQWRK